MIPVEYAEGRRLEQMHVCGECEGRLVTVCVNGQWFLRCGNNAEHSRVAKVKSYTQRYNEGGGLPLHIANKIEERRRKQMTAQEQGLARYHGITSLTQADAMTILSTIWPKAPKAEMVKAALLCRDYGLNPLMRHVFLICFNEGKPTEKWETILGIGASRLIAARAGKYDYYDGPRIMSEEEQKHLRGEVDLKAWWAITIIEQGGRHFPGYGSWPKGATPYGSEKGNSAQNMAMIRSERNALARLAPGSFPEVGVEDETYIDSTAKELSIDMGEAPEPQGQAEAVSSSSSGSPAGKQATERPATPSPAGAGPAGAPPKPDIPAFKTWGDFMTWVREGWPTRTQSEVLREAGTKVFPTFSPRAAQELAQTLVAVWGPRRVSTEGMFPGE